MANKIRHVILSILYTLKPRRLVQIPGLTYALANYFLFNRKKDKPFPPVESAMKYPDGLLMVGGPVTAERLISAYKQGIVPFCHLLPMKWWAPSHRMILIPHQLHIEKNLRRRIRRHDFQVTFDTAFPQVVRACAEPRPRKIPLTWISNDFMNIFLELHEQGYAHSVECWTSTRELVGGIFGIGLGKVFINESQYSKVRDASKYAMAYLNCHLHAWGYAMHDCINYSDHLGRLGARSITRQDYMKLLNENVDKQCHKGVWQVDPDLDISNWVSESRPTKAA